MDPGIAHPPLADIGGECDSRWPPEVGGARAELVNSYLTPLGLLMEAGLASATLEVLDSAKRSARGPPAAGEELAAA